MPAKPKPFKAEKVAAESPSKSSGVSPNALAAFSYILGWLSALIVLVIEKENKFVRFHATQSLILNLVFIVTYLLAIGCLLSPLFLLYSIYLAYKAYTGEKYKIPYIGEYAEKHAEK